MMALRCAEADRSPVHVLNAVPQALEYMDESWHGLLRLALEKTEIMASVGTGGQPLYSAWTHANKNIVQEKSDQPGWFERTTIYPTPNGDISEVTKVNPAGNQSVTLKHLIENEDDVTRFLSIPDEPISYDLSELLVLDAQVADTGIVGIYCPEPGCWVHDVLGSETIAFWTVDKPQLLHDIYDKIHRNQMDLLKRVFNQAPGRVLFSGCGAEKWIPPLVSPNDFEEFLAPSLKEIADIVHEHEGLLWYHCHGRVRNFIERFVELGVDCLQPLEAPPLGDVTLAEAKKLAAGKMCLEGNVQWGDVVTSTPEEVRTLTRSTIEQGAPHGAFILGLTAGLHGATLSQADSQRLSAFIEEGVRLS